MAPSLQAFRAETTVDGLPRACRFSHARGHMCLEHAKKLSSSRFSDGCRKLVPSLQEFIAFLPKHVRHVAAVDLLDRLQAAGQTKGHTYLATAGGWIILRERQRLLRRLMGFKFRGR